MKLKTALFLTMVMIFPSTAALAAVPSTLPQTTVCTENNLGELNCTGIDNAIYKTRGYGPGTYQYSVAIAVNTGANQLITFDYGNQGKGLIIQSKLEYNLAPVLESSNWESLGPQIYSCENTSSQCPYSIQPKK